MGVGGSIRPPPHKIVWFKLCRSSYLCIAYIPNLGPLGPLFHVEKWWWWVGGGGQGWKKLRSLRSRILDNSGLVRQMRLGPDEAALLVRQIGQAVLIFVFV